MNEKINLQELIVLLTQKSTITKKEAETFLKECFETMHEALLNDRLIKVKNLGTFKLSRVNDRESIDVVTGERVLIPAHYKVSFSAENALAQAINEPFSLFVPLELNEDDSIVDSDEVITFSEEIDMQENDELADNLEDNDDADFELILEEPETEKDTILFTPNEENENDTGTQDGDFILDLNDDTDEIDEVNDVAEINDVDEADDDIFAEEDINEEYIPVEPEIERPNEVTFNLTRDFNEIIGEINVPVEIPSIPEPEEPQIEISLIPESVEPQIEIPSMPEFAEPQIETPPVPEPSEWRREPQIEAPPAPIVPAGERPFLPNAPVRENYTIYKHGKRKLRYPGWLVVPTYLAIILIVVFIFYRLYQNPGVMGESVPPVSSVENAENKDAGNDVDADKIREKKITLTPSEDSLLNVLKSKYGEHLVGLPDNTASGNKPAENKPARNKPAENKSLSGNQISGNGKIITIRYGQTLTTLALNEYGNKCFWIYIYEENRQILKNPNDLPVGTQLTIPPPQKYNINKNDAASVRKATEKADQMQARN
ncbi:MAG: HU family DNA-binding protein [Dysgonamonadaceae bacterium]|jgi:nucleoid DNA-binding protein|nr:HU family DNA-binding protein [Dysgonamonadaceae bacterium]